MVETVGVLGGWATSGMGGGARLHRFRVEIRGRNAGRKKPNKWLVWGHLPSATSIRRAIATAMLG